MVTHLTTTVLLYPKLRPEDGRITVSESAVSDSAVSDSSVNDSAVSASTVN